MVDHFFGFETFDNMTPSEQRFLIMYAQNETVLSPHMKLMTKNWVFHISANDNDDSIDELEGLVSYDLFVIDEAINFARCLIQCKFNRLLTKLTYTPDNRYG